MKNPFKLLIDKHTNSIIKHTRILELRTWSQTLEDLNLALTTLTWTSRGITGSGYLKPPANILATPHNSHVVRQIRHSLFRGLATHLKYEVAPC